MGKSRERDGRSNFCPATNQSTTCLDDHLVIGRFQGVNAARPKTKFSAELEGLRMPCVGPAGHCHTARAVATPKGCCFLFSLAMNMYLRLYAGSVLITIARAMVGHPVVVR